MRNAKQLSCQRHTNYEDGRIKKPIEYDGLSLWEHTGSNRGPSACKADALNQLSYAPFTFSTAFEQCSFVVGSANIGAHFIPAKIFLKSFLFLHMQSPTSYCDAVLPMDQHNVHRHYHDEQYGFPILDDNELFGRLVLEINQAGLSWTTILNKKDNFYKAYDQFNIKKVAKYDERKFEALMNDAGIIRNRLKINAAIENAKTVQQLQKEHGSFKQWLDQHHPKTKQEWTKLFKQTFRFTGGEIVNEFLMSTGYLEGAHVLSCPIYKTVLKQKPKWMEKE
jgi:DNA-3-methyladenine glycosylase I